MIKGHKTEKLEDPADFMERLKNIESDSIRCSAHALFRLSEKQRKIFTETELKRFLTGETPVRVGIQNNGNYSAYYEMMGKTEVMRMVVNIKPASAEIITFYFIDRRQLPRG